MKSAGTSKKKDKRRDPRITERYQWLKGGILLFVILTVVNSSHIMIYQATMEIEPTVQNLLVPEMLSFLFFAAGVLCVVMTVGRYLTYDKPIARLGEAARDIASGDFSVRVPMRKVKKKGSLDILVEDFNTMAQELAGSETLKTDFIANVSHEIRTPLAVIHNYAYQLKKEQLSPEGAENLNTIMTASMSMSKMVGNILQLNSLENKEILPEPKSYNLSEQIIECVLAFEEKWERKSLILDADVDEDITVCYDRFMLEIIWNNLIENAVKFTPNGGTIGVRLKSEKGYAVITVFDTGCGIDEETGKHIFTKFYQADTSHGTEGNGLGLALVHKIIELVDGGIEVNSEPGQGSAFTVYLKMG